MKLWARIGMPHALSARMNKSTSTRAKTSPSEDGLAAELLDDAKEVLQGNGAAVVDRVKELGSTSFQRVRKLITAHPFESVAIGIGAGLVLRSLFRGPLMTVMMLGGAGYIGSRFAAK
ncbi:MAG TPA: hypothetical protein VFQ65_26115 [Kofleriaceae bacterium]|nr:hypothetical protein [Kofleriaceae bacterium]